MSGLTSSAPFAMTALLGHFQTIASNNPALNLQVSDGEAIEYLAANWLQLTGLTNGEQVSSGLGNLRRKETYVLESLIRVWQGDVDSSTVRGNAFALLEDVIELITADPSAGGTIIFWQLQDYSLEQGLTAGGGWAAEITFGIACMVEIEQ